MDSARDHAGDVEVLQGIVNELVGNPLAIHEARSSRTRCHSPDATPHLTWYNGI